MLLKTAELISILVAALAGGMFWGPWLALTISISTFTPEVFLALTARLSRNLGAVMTILLPLAILAMVPVLILTYALYRTTFYFTLVSFALYVTALFVTLWIEVPLVHQMERWTVTTLPVTWTQIRDRWAFFHIIRVVTAIVGLGVLVAGALAG